MTLKLLITFYTSEPKPVEIYHLNANNPDEVQKYNDRIVELTKHKAKFTVSIIGDCVGDYS